MGEKGGEEGRGGNERVKTKTEWVSMRVLNTHAKKQMKCKQYTSNNGNEKQVMGGDEWHINVKETGSCLPT